MITTTSMTDRIPSGTDTPALDQPAVLDLGRWGEIGEFPVVSERMLVAPMQGRFEPTHVGGDDVSPGQVVGEVVRSDERVPVVATAPGRFMGHLAERGERVRDGQPLAWIRLAV
jgi:hypothetical protein